VFTEQEAIHAIKDRVILYFQTYYLAYGPNATEEQKCKQEDELIYIQNYLKDVQTPKQLNFALNCLCTDGDTEEDGTIPDGINWEKSLCYRYMLWFECKLNKQVIQLNFSV